MKPGVPADLALNIGASKRGQLVAPFIDMGVAVANPHGVTLRCGSLRVRPFSEGVSGSERGTLAVAYRDAVRQ
jgi:hypothetical protein